MLQVFDKVGIEAIASCVPKRIISNDDFGDLLNTKERKVFEKTVNIFERRWASDEVTSIDLGFYAARQLFEKYKIDKDEVGCLIFLSQTPEYKIPFSSNILQSKLNLNKSILCLDINAGCAGFIQGLSTAFSITKSLGGKKTLFIISETLSKILSRQDRSTSMLFGDGASAMLISSEDHFEQVFFDFYSDGDNFDAIMIPEGGYRIPFNQSSLIGRFDENNNVLRGVDLHMKGQKVFDFTLREIASSIKTLLDYTDVKLDEIGCFLLHQSNAFIIKQIAGQLGLEWEKFLINISKYGNTSGVSIPLLISDFRDLLHDQDYVVMSGYGSGLNWANALINFKNTIIFPIEEM